MIRSTPMRASGDRWLFGYADVVTLLFACFAALYATRLHPEAADAPSIDLPTEERPAVAAAAAPAKPPEPAAAAETPADDVHDRFAAILGRDGVLPGIEMTGTTRGLVISLPEAGSFPAGTAEISPMGRRVMLQLAATLNTLPNVIRVEGHTDDIPIHNATFASNWELSTARATRVVQFLIDEGGVDPSRLSAAGYAEHRPRLPNDSAASRARNRRVDIVVLDPAVATREEPGGVR